MGYHLGVDLGTTFTAAAIQQRGQVEVVPLGDNGAQIPSVLYLRSDGQLLVGEAAVRRASEDPGRVAREFKRRLGDPVPVSMGPEAFPPELLMAHLLRWVVHTVSHREGVAPDGIVLTHPAIWGPHRLALLQDVIRLADVGPATTCSEPEAAALHFASTERVDDGQTVAVYDLGGGTFDAATLRKTPAGFELLGSAQGIDNLGGADFNQEIFDFVTNSIGFQLGDSYEDDPSAVAAFARLQRECASAKEALSSDVDTTIGVALPELTTSVRLTREEFEGMIRDPLGRTVERLQSAVLSAHVTLNELQAVVLVGGSARIPLVSQLLTEKIGRPIAVDNQPKLAVALGAALLTVTAEPAPAQVVTISRHLEPPPTVAPPSGATAALPPEAAEGVQASDGPSKSLLMAALVAMLLASIASAWFFAPAAKPPKSTNSHLSIWSNSSVYPVAKGFATVDLSHYEIKLRDKATPALSLSLDLIGSDESKKVDGFHRLWAAGSIKGHIHAPPDVHVKDAALDKDFVIKPDQPFIATVPGVLTILLLLFVLAYTESVLRSAVHRGWARAADHIAMSLLGAMTGIVFIAVSWMIGGNLPPDLSQPLGVVLTLSCSAAAGDCLLRLLVAQP